MPRWMGGSHAAVVALFLALQPSGASADVDPAEVFDVEVPDTVYTGQSFAVTISSADERVTSMTSRVPSLEFAVYQSSSTSSSFRTVQTPSGAVTARTQRLTIHYLVDDDASGTGLVGPFSVYAGSDLGYVTIPPVVVRIAAGPSSASTGSPSGRRVDPFSGPLGTRQLLPELQLPGDLAWIEMEGGFEDEMLFPGVPFYVTYYLYSRDQFRHVSVGWEPGENLVTRQEEFRETMNWEYVAPGVWREQIVTLELTPVAAGSLSLPAVILLAERAFGGFAGSSEVTIESTPVRLPVYPFPETDRPGNFDGVVDSLCIRLLPGESFDGQGGEMSLRLEVGGPGAIHLDSIPRLTVSGPAELHVVGQGSDGEKARWWDLVVDPSDSGTVILGPDSLAWFDRSELLYRQSRLHPCTLRISRPPREIQPVLPEYDDDDGSQQLVLPILIVGLGLLLAVGIALLVRRGGAGRRRGRAALAEVRQCDDLEDLFTVYEACTVQLLSGEVGQTGADGLQDLLEERGVDRLLCRSLVRHWRDLEHALMGRALRGGELNRMKNRACELIEMLQQQLEEEGKD